MARDMVQVRRPTTNQFAQEPQVRIGRSQFNRSHGRKMSFDASYLYPILVDDVLPGDTFTCKLSGFARIFSPLDAPVMDNIEVETFFFFVPNRLVWEHWEDMNGQHDGAGAQDTTYQVPAMGGTLVVDHDNSGVTHHNLAAYMGLPDGLQTSNTVVISLPFRAYNLIYNEWFRDQNVQGEVSVYTDDASDTVSAYSIRKSFKKHDYLTSCLPYLQKGTAQTVELAGTPSVRFAGLTGENPTVYADTYSTLQELDAGAAQVDLSATVGTDGPLYIDLTDGSVDINALRYSVAIQRLLERDARGGTRYVENIKTHFGVTSPDFRLQRPEFLGGGRSFINVSAVANTSSTATEDQGELRGVGAGTVNGSFAKSFTEHGFIIGLIRARADLTYFQGIDRMWGRRTRYDYYIPALAHLGEQSVLNREVWIDNSSTDDEVFGYQERWSEYRYKASQVVGLFNPDVSGALSHWHLAEDFGTRPSLNATFLEDNSTTPIARVTTVDTEHDFIADLWFDYKCARPIPVHSIPSLMGGRF